MFPFTLGSFARDLLESHKKAGFSVVLENNPSFIFNQLSFCKLQTVHALLLMPLFLLFCCQVTFCALVYFYVGFCLVAASLPQYQGLKNSRKRKPYFTIKLQNLGC